MNIKQIFERVIYFFTGKTSNERKQLPIETSNSPKEILQSRGFFSDSLGNGIPKQETTNLEKDYNTALENYNEVFKEIEKLIAEMQILANEQIQIGEQIHDPIEYAKIEKDNHIKDAGQKAAEKAEKEGEQPETRHYLRKVAQALAEGEWMDNTSKYFETALSTFIQSKIKEMNHENYTLSSDERTKIEIIQKIVCLLIEEKAITGNLDGMRYAVLKHGVVSSKKTEIMTNLDATVDKFAEYSWALKTLADVKAIGVDMAGKSEYMKNLDAIIYDVNRSIKGVYAGVNEMYVKAFRRALEKWSIYIESGGVVPDAGMFEKEFLGDHEFFPDVDEEAVEEVIQAAKNNKAANDKIKDQHGE